jgi:hypothetical protein
LLDDMCMAAFIARPRYAGAPLLDDMCMAAFIARPRYAGVPLTEKRA